MWGRIWRITRVVIALCLLVPLALVVIYRFVPPPGTPQMFLRNLSGGDVSYSWVPMGQLPPALGRAVIAEEDQKFCRHHGFDWNSIGDALKDYSHGHGLRGASTISQQAARSLLLLPVRSWVRKGAEAYITVLMETFMPKRRILELYLNVVDWGHGNFGAEAAAQAYFHKSAHDLTASDAARLAAVLPNPDEWRIHNPDEFVAQRADDAVGRMAIVTRDGLDRCVRKIRKKH